MSINCVLSVIFLFLYFCAAWCLNVVPCAKFHSLKHSTVLAIVRWIQWRHDLRIFFYCDFPVIFWLNIENFVGLWHVFLIADLNIIKLWKKKKVTYFSKVCPKTQKACLCQKYSGDRTKSLKWSLSNFVKKLPKGSLFVESLQSYFAGPSTNDGKQKTLTDQKFRLLSINFLSGIFRDFPWDAPLKQLEKPHFLDYLIKIYSLKTFVDNNFSSTGFSEGVK